MISGAPIQARVGVTSGEGYGLDEVCGIGRSVSPPKNSPRSLSGLSAAAAASQWSRLAKRGADLPPHAAPSHLLVHLRPKPSRLFFNEGGLFRIVRVATHNSVC